APVVGAPRVGERDELAQRQERDEAEQERRADRPRHPRDPEHDRGGPERAQLAREELAQRSPLGSDVSQRLAAREDRDDAEQAEEDDEEQADLLADAERAQVGHHATSRSAITAARARSRNARRSSAGASAIGGPKTTVHRIGTGTTSPFGMTRCTLSIHAGTSGTSGNACASA